MSLDAVTSRHSLPAAVTEQFPWPDEIPCALCAVESNWFEGATFIFVVVNMGLLASYRYDHSKVHESYECHAADFSCITQRKPGMLNTRKHQTRMQCESSAWRSTIASKSTQISLTVCARHRSSESAGWTAPRNLSPTCSWSRSSAASATRVRRLCFKGLQAQGKLNFTEERRRCL